MIKVDLHNHLGRNGDNPGFDETIDIAHSRLGSGGIFGICNDGPDDKRYERFVEQPDGNYDRVPLTNDKKGFWIPQRNIYVIGIEEAESVEGSFIAVGMPVDKKIHSKKTTLKLEDALKSAIDLDTTRIIVHPFFKEGMGEYLKQNPEMLKYFDGFEVYNASAELWVPGILPKNANSNAAQFYEYTIKDKYEVGAVSFTDGHTCEVIGTSYTEIADPFQDNSLYSLFFLELEKRIVNSGDDDRLHKQPAKWDAFKHAYHMGKHMIFGTSA